MCVLITSVAKKIRFSEVVVGVQYSPVVTSVTHLISWKEAFFDCKSPVVASTEPVVPVAVHEDSEESTFNFASEEPNETLTKDWVASTSISQLLSDPHILYLASDAFTFCLKLYSPSGPYPQIEASLDFTSV